MKKEQKVALVLAGLLALNTLPGCANKTENNDNKNETTSTEEVKEYRVEDLYVVFSKTMTGETLPYIITREPQIFYYDYNEVLSNTQLVRNHLEIYNNDYICYCLVDYLNIDEMQEYVSIEELKSITARLQQELGNHKEEKLKLTKSPSQDNEKTYKIKDDIIIGEVQKTTGEKDLYIIRNGLEVFTNVPISYMTWYNIIDFIEIEDYKEEYTESELKEILEYARTKYHGMKEENTLELTK